MNTRENFNVSRHLLASARKYPDRKATVVSNGSSITFRQMAFETARMAEFFKRAGISSGMRVVTFVRPGLDFVPCIFGLFRIGAVPIFIDPGMKPKNMLACLEEAEPEAMVGVPLAHLLKMFFPRSFHSVKISVTLGNGRIWGKLFSSQMLPPVQPNRTFRGPISQEGMGLGKEAPAAIIFTSGSTGLPKGVEFTHGIFEMQQEMLRKRFSIGENEVDLVPFPLFALYSAAWGITSVIPRMNPARPAKVNGRHLAALINRHGVTHASGSPVIWKRLIEACMAENIQIPTLRRILMAGAPVSEKIVRACRSVLAPGARVYTPYGATEALPVTSIDDQELVGDCYSQTRQGKGTCVGRPLADIDVRIIEVCDTPLEDWKIVREMTGDSVGEVVVQGEIVTRSYFNRPSSNQLSKIADEKEGTARFWHRMGDLGYFDSRGRLWLCGRKDHRIKTPSEELYPVQLEGIFNQHPRVLRSALVGVEAREGSKTPVLVVNRQGILRKTRLKAELMRLAREHSLTSGIREIVFKKRFPVDVRHNIKIDRPALARYAARKVTVR